MNQRELILVTGGARAGKSDYARRLAEEFSTADAESDEKTVLFVATAEAGDPEMVERIQNHRASRPARWQTLEEPLHLVEAITRVSVGDGIVLIDCLNLWVSNLLLSGQDREPAVIEKQVLDAAGRLLDYYERAQTTFILVTNEVGLGLVPTHPLGRQFRDVLGKVNQMVAAKADRVYLLVSGLPLELKSLSSGQL